MCAEQRHRAFQRFRLLIKLRHFDSLSADSDNACVRIVFVYNHIPDIWTRALLLVHKEGSLRPDKRTRTTMFVSFFCLNIYLTETVKHLNYIII